MPPRSSGFKAAAVCPLAVALSILDADSPFHTPDGDPILGEFFVKYAAHAAALNVDPEALYKALLADAEDQPPNWNLQGRQANIWKSLGYVPQDLIEPGGANTKQVSRTLEYAFNDFAVAQVAKLLNRTADAEKYATRAGNFVNVWDPDTVAPDNDTIVGMMQVSCCRCAPCMRLDCADDVRIASSPEWHVRVHGPKTL